LCTGEKFFVCVVCREKEGPGRRFAFVQGRRQVCKYLALSLALALALSRKQLPRLSNRRASVTTPTPLHQQRNGNGNGNGWAGQGKTQPPGRPDSTAQHSTDFAHNVRMPECQLVVPVFLTRGSPIAGVEIGCNDRWSCSSGVGRVSAGHRLAPKQ
jgi:hypothetical protein